MRVRDRITEQLERQRNKPRVSRLLEIDAWIDSKLYEFFSRLRNGYDAFSSFMARFHMAGLKRLFFGTMSDGLSFGVIGGCLVLIFAQPAFEETDEAWRQSTQFSVTFTDRHGNIIGKRGILHNDAVPLEEIPDHMVKAVLATEDRRFFDHFGIDFLGLFRALAENLRANSVVQGGSTLTQQLAKNLFLTPERTIERKIKEAFLALWLEARLSKREILKLYLDRAYLGAGTVGVDAAAEYYFGKSVRDITIAEACMLAGLFKAPSKFAPHANLPAARGRANEVLDNMVEAGFITQGEVYGARQNPATVIDQREAYVPNYFLDWAYTEVQRLAKGNDYVLTAKTSVDLTLQKAAEQAIDSSLRQFGQRYGTKQAAMVVVEVDGAVRAMVGGRDYGESQFNRAVDALRQPGSAFKPFVYVTALQNGYSPNSIVVDAPITIGNWSPKNYGRSYRGRVTLTTALTKSINTIPVRLSQAFGRDKIAETARQLGIRSNILVTRALPLGVAEVTVLDMAGSYAVFANGGKKATPYGILEIRNTDGDVLYDRARDEPPPQQVISRKHAEQMNYMLSHVVEQGTGRRAKLDFTVAAGKTGTTQAYRDAWFMGYTGKYVAGVWFGNDDFTSTRRMTGGSLPAMTWKQFMSVAHTENDLIKIPGAVDPRDLLADAGTADHAEAAGTRRTNPQLPRPSALPPPLVNTLDNIQSLLTNSQEIRAEESDEQTEAKPAAQPVSQVARKPGQPGGVGEH